MSLLSADYGECPHKKVIEDYRFLKELFKLEFIHDEKISDDQNIERCLNFLQSGRQLNIIGENGGRKYAVTPKGREEMVYFAAMLTNFLEAYDIVFNNLPTLKKKPANEKDMLGRLTKTGNRLYKQGGVLRPEALSQLLYKNALRYANNEGMIRKEDTGAKYPVYKFISEKDDMRNQLLTHISKFIRVEKYHYLDR